MGKHALAKNLNLNYQIFTRHIMEHSRNNNIRNTIRDQYRKLAILDDFGYCGLTSCCVNSRIINTSDNTVENNTSDNTVEDANTRNRHTVVNNVRDKNTGKHDVNDVCGNSAYTSVDIKKVPEGAHMGLGCGNPSIIADLKRGEIVLDLGSGGGFDCFLAAHKVGDSGFVIGVDMTAEMINKACNNAEKSGYKNVEFRLGEIECLPVAGASVDVIISNCVINLSPEKERVFAEAFRVLKPGGRLTVSDIILTAVLPEKFRSNMKMRAGCILGASFLHDLESMLKRAGFIEIQIRPQAESKKFIQNWVPDSQLEDYIVSANIEAIKP